MLIFALSNGDGVIDTSAGCDSESHRDRRIVLEKKYSFGLTLCGMRRIAPIFIMILMGTAYHAEAQLTYGFRAGLSYSKFLGDYETNAMGEELEEYRFASGFHIGMALNYAVTDLFGFRGELIFTQRGTEYRYEGESFYFLAHGTQDQRIITGTRTMDINVSTAILEMPLIAYFRAGALEISGGVNLSVLMAATGGGILDFERMSPSGNDEPFRVILTHNYIKDRALGAGILNMPVRVDGATILTADRTGAYYNFAEKNGNLYNTLDIGLTGGLSFYLNEGLYLGARVIYGLLDVDDNQYDISYRSLDASNNFNYRSDKNRNLTIQASIGFLF